MMRKLLFILFLGASLSAAGQSAAQADAWFTAQDYKKAQAAYENLLRRNPNNALYLYRIARCAQELGDTQTAIRRFEQAGEKYALRNYYLGELYFGEYRFAEAMAAYGRYLESIEPTHNKYDYVRAQLARAEKGERYLKRVEDVSIISRMVVAKQDFLQVYDLSPETGKLIAEEGKVTYINQRGDRKVTTGGSNARTDLFFSQRLIDSWADSIALPVPINTDAGENYPFLLTDGITLYFGSDRGEGLGGYDIYMSRYNSTTDSYLQPENVGMPFNSFANDYMLAIDEARGIGYFATDRNTAADSVSVYCFVPNAEKKILRNSSDETVRLSAQLKVYRKAQRDTNMVAHYTETEVEDEDMEDFVLVVNDSMIYYHWQDFTSKEAVSLYRNYRQTARQHQQNIEVLQRLRYEYTTATEDEQLALGKQILALEEEIPMRKGWLQSTLNEIRRLENEALKTSTNVEK